MTIAALLTTLVRNLPTILAIIEHVDRLAKERATEAKIDESLAGIEEAFRKKDADALRRYLNS